MTVCPLDKLWLNRRVLFVQRLPKYASIKGQVMQRQWITPRTSDVLVDGALLISRGGRTGGGDNVGLIDGTTGASVASSLKKELIRSRLPPLSLPGPVGPKLIRISASRVES
jgi:hypothetical protein